MKYLLDTNIIIAFQKRHQGLLAQMKKHSVSDFALSNIVLFSEEYLRASGDSKLPQ